MIVVSNTTPLIGLASINQFHLLHAILGEIFIPTAVYHEVVTQGRESGGAKQQVTEANWIKTIAVQDELAVQLLLDELDRGEAETIVLAKELAADWVVMDEKKGRRKLSQVGLPKIGTIGILVKAKQVGLISQLHPELERLRSQGFSISQSVIDSVLVQVGEA